ncbi:MAG: hypothetical protein ACYCQM_13650, partial [Acidithiobacillus sp.]
MDFSTSTRRSNPCSGIKKGRWWAIITTSRDVLPTRIISESGRSLTAHHAILLADVSDVEMAAGEHPPSAPSIDLMA